MHLKNSPLPLSAILDRLQNFGWSPQSITVTYSGVETISENYQSLVDAYWIQYLTENPSSYDGDLLRLSAVEAFSESINFFVKRTKFSRYVATRDAASPLVKLGYRAEPLGMTALVSTLDGRYLVTRRSLNTDQNPGLFYCVGGYPEITANSHNPIDLTTELLRETQEELGLLKSDISEVKLLGVVYDRKLFHPEAFFHIRVNCYSDSLMTSLNCFKSAELFNFRICSLDELLDLCKDRNRTTWSLSTAAKLLMSHVQNKSSKNTENHS